MAKKKVAKQKKIVQPKKEVVVNTVIEEKPIVVKSNPVKKKIEEKIAYLENDKIEIEKMKFGDAKILKNDAVFAEGKIEALKWVLGII